ncbi:hypothetical protein CerSpe_226480 [Prunus speciosa]
MEEGSPGVYMKHHRFTKRVRASEDFNPECELEQRSNPIPFIKQGQTADSLLGARSEFGFGNFKEGARSGFGSGNLRDGAQSDFVSGNVIGAQSEFGSGSFKDKLMGKVNLVKNVGIDVCCLSDTHEDLNDDDDVVISRGEKGLSIQFSDRAMDRLSQPWKHALIIKLLGRSHAYNYIHDRLQQKWSLKGDWKLIDLVNDYFVVKFDLEEDLIFVLTGGPWIIAGQYLVMQKWRPGFCPATAHITRMAAWIRVAAIQLECVCA